MTADVLVVYITCAGREEALRIARAAVTEGLAACGNLRPHDSVYRWEGRVEEAAEVGLLLKTTREAYPALEARVRALHSYELPCIVAWPVERGLPGYLDWVASSVAWGPAPPG